MHNSPNQHYFVRFSFLFVSLISPNFIKNFTTFFNYNLNTNKIQLKQSYVLFSWFYYMTVVEKRNKKLKFFVLPLKNYTTTQIKAPIAHKNWSKEQFALQFFLLRITFKSLFIDTLLPNSPDSGLLFVLLSKKHFPLVETNIFFLKNYKIIFFLRDVVYFNYYKSIR
jgi:hypothetical protein